MCQQPLRTNCWNDLQAVSDFSIVFSWYSQNFQFSFRSDLNRLNAGSETSINMILEGRKLPAMTVLSSKAETSFHTQVTRKVSKFTWFLNLTILYHKRIHDPLPAKSSPCLRYVCLSFFFLFFLLMSDVPLQTKKPFYSWFPFRGSISFRSFE